MERMTHCEECQTLAVRDHLVLIMTLCIINNHYNQHFVAV